MCTVVYAPLPDRTILASLRDESPARYAARSPEVQKSADTSWLMPLDPAGNGSWIGVNDRRTAVVLLNGAFQKHRHQPPYAMSRGLVVSALLNSVMPVVEWMLMPMEGVEPYTLVVLAEGKLFRLTWDGQKKHRTTLDETVCHIFSSATLYDDDAAARRKEYFDDWVAMDPPFDRLSLLSFFKSVKDANNGFIMDRGHVKTLSYSYLCMRNDSCTFYYYDLQNYKVDSKELMMTSFF